MGIPFSEALEYELISHSVLENIIDRCPECGHEIMFTDTLKQVYCPNRMCFLKIAVRLENMAKAMGIDGWGSSTCLTVCRQFKLKSPFQVFIIDPNKRYNINVSVFNKKLDAILEKSKRSVSLGDIVRYAGIPSIDTIANKLFDEYDSMSEVYELIEKHQVLFISKKLGISDSADGVMAINVYNLLMEYKGELMFAEGLFEVRPAIKNGVDIAITGNVDGFKNKRSFIDYVNRRFGKHVSFKLSNTVTAKTRILIADINKSSDKLAKALKLRDSGRNIAIMSGQELIDQLISQFER